MLSDLLLDCISAVMPDEEPGVLGSPTLSEERDQATPEIPKDRPKALFEVVSPAPLSPSYERTDSEIELEIEAELEAMKQAEKITRSLGLADHDSKLTATVDWSDVSRASISPDQSTPKQAKGRLKLTIDKIQKGDESGSAQTRDRHAEAARKETGNVMRPPTETARKETVSVTRPTTVQKKTDDQWEDDGWEDFDNVPKSSSPSSSKISSPSAKVNLSSGTQWSRMKSIEEQPLGAGYDIMLIDVKTKPVEKGSEFDFFADMAPEIKPSGSSLMNILTGGKSDKGEIKATEKSSTASRSLHNQRGVVNTFDVVEADNTVSVAELYFINQLVVISFVFWMVAIKGMVKAGVMVK